MRQVGNCLIDARWGLATRKSFDFRLGDTGGAIAIRNEQFLTFSIIEFRRRAVRLLGCC